MTAQQYAQAWYAALSESKPAQWEDISQHVLRRLQREGKLSQLAFILDQMKEIESEQSGKAYVEVTTAHASDKSELESLVKDLLKVKDVELTLKENPELIGGAVIRTKNDLWDLSVKHQLEQLQDSLKN